jgi:transcriptional regulator with XRE-family HTH domain
MITPELLKKIRTENNLTQEEFANKLGVTSVYLCRLETEAKPITHKFEMKLKESGFLQEEVALKKEWFDRLTESELQTLEKITKEDKAALILFLDAVNGDIAKIELLSQYLKSRYTVNISE